MSTTRRKFLGHLTAAATAIPIAKSLLALERTAAAQAPSPPPLHAPPASTLPFPLDEPIIPSDVGSLYGPITRIRDAYGWATESFTADKFKPAAPPAWHTKIRA